MNSVLQSIQAQVAEFESKKQLLYKELRSQMKDIFTPVFELHPGVESFSWTQYTPYFNDGDECTFSVNYWADSIYINGIDPYDDDEEDEDGNPIISSKDREAAAELASEILQQLPEEFLREMYGNHQKITIYKDGKFDTEEYDHD